MVWLLGLLAGVPVLAVPEADDDPDAAADTEDTPADARDTPADERTPTPADLPDPSRASPRVPGRAASGAESAAERPDGVPEGWTEVPLSTKEDGEAEIVVSGTRAIREAREQIVAAFETEGWEVRKRKDDGDIIFAGRQPWMGSARLDLNGMVQFRRRWMWVEPVEVVEGPPTDGMEAADRTVRSGRGTRTRGGLHGPASAKKVEVARRDVLQAIDPSLRRYRAVLAETALQSSLRALPDRLDRLWSSGEPLTEGPLLATPAERRAAVLDYWATRPDSRAGKLAMETVEDWISEVMQDSDHPASPAELDAAAAQRGDGSHPTE